MIKKVEDSLYPARKVN